MTNNDLYNLAEENGIEVLSFKLTNCKSLSLTNNDNYYIGIDYQSVKNTSDEKVHLAHELGHCMTGALYNEYSPFTLRSKYEYKADKWAVLNLIPKEEFLSLLQQGFEVWEIAEHFEVNEELVNKAYHFYCKMEIIS